MADLNYFTETLKRINKILLDEEEDLWLSHAFHNIALLQAILTSIAKLHEKLPYKMLNHYRFDDLEGNESETISNLHYLRLNEFEELLQTFHNAKDEDAALRILDKQAEELHLEIHDNLKNNDSVWEEAFTDILTGKWQVYDTLDNLAEYTIVLLAYYERLIDHDNELVSIWAEVIPTFLEVQKKLNELIRVTSFLIPTATKDMKRLKERISRTETARKTKYKNWEEMIILIESLHNKGVLEECQSRNNLATKISAFILTSESYHGHKHSINTITRCLQEVYQIESNATPPFDLSSKDFYND